MEPLLLLLWGNALRRNEVSTLNVGHFDANARVLWIQAKGKSDARLYRAATPSRQVSLGTYH